MCKSIKLQNNILPLWWPLKKRAQTLLLVRPTPQSSWQLALHSNGNPGVYFDPARQKYRIELKYRHRMTLIGDNHSIFRFPTTGDIIYSSWLIIFIQNVELFCHSWFSIWHFCDLTMVQRYSPKLLVTLKLNAGMFNSKLTRQLTSKLTTKVNNNNNNKTWCQYYGKDIYCTNYAQQQTNKCWIHWMSNNNQNHQNIAKHNRDLCLVRLFASTRCHTAEENQKIKI